MSDATDRLQVQVNLGPKSYEIAIVSGQLASFAEQLDSWIKSSAAWTKSKGVAFLVTDENVSDSHAAVVRAGLVDAGWNCHQLTLEAGEQSKLLSVISRAYDQLIALCADRHTAVIAVGGGVVGDAAGFVAATYTRGVHFVQVPTTLLAQVDSSVGGKVGVNHPEAKNMIGAFYQPLGVFIDTSVLETLPDRDYRSGLAEVVKYGVILDADFFEYLESNVDGLNRRAPDVLRQVVARCCRLKADVVEQDEFERTGARAVLNYGHTFAHAFETLAGYGELLHGEAVAIGMVYASRFAERLELIDSPVTRRQEDLLKQLHLPTAVPEAVGLTTEDVLDRMKLDKKVVAGRLRFVLPTELGRVEVFEDVNETQLREVLAAEFDG